MRQVTRTEHIPPAIQRARESPHFQEILQRKAKVKAAIYKGTAEGGERLGQTSADCLRHAYHDKCAYCEDTEHKPEIEHYRPKNGVHKDTEHPGYYWLCYEWSNLLPACHDCNTNGGKGTQFPVLGARVFEPPMQENGALDFEKFGAAHPHMTAERPMLLHPELDDPKHFFRFDSVGSIFGTDREGRGEATIRICNLRRGNLLVRRKRITDDVVQDIKRALCLYAFDKNAASLKRHILLILKDLEQKQTPKEPFTLFSWYLFENFADLVPPLMESPAQGDFVKKAYLHFRKTI